MKDFIECLGKFEGDSFEALYFSINNLEKAILVKTSIGEQIRFDLSRKALVFEDENDRTIFILDYHHNIIVFKVTMKVF